MKKLLVSLTVVGLLLVAGAYWVSPSHSSGSEAEYTKAGVLWGDLTEVVSATGQLSPRTISLVSSPVGGQVVRIYPNADYNHVVREGEPLLELDQSQAKLKIQEAEQSVEAAKADGARAEAACQAAQAALKHLKGLPESAGVQSKVAETEYLLKGAQAALRAAQFRVKALQAQFAEAKLGLDKTVVRAPATGVIVDRKVILGQMVGPQAPNPLFTIASDLGQMQVNAQIGEGDLSKVRSGLDATFTVYAYSEHNERFEGRVKEIRYLPSNVQGAVFYNTVIDVKNRRAGGGEPAADEPWMLRPGMTATVDIVIRRHRGVWKVPTAALTLQLDEHYQTEAAKAKLSRWQGRSDRDDWKPVWVLGDNGKPWPVFVRLGGGNAAREPGIKDGQFTEALEWEPDLAVKPDPKDPRTYPQVILSAPPATKPGVFDRPTRLFS